MDFNVVLSKSNVHRKKLTKIIFFKYRCMVNKLPLLLCGFEIPLTCFPVNMIFYHYFHFAFFFLNALQDRNE